MIIGYFDLTVIGILILVNALIWNKGISIKVGCLVGGLIFGLILPLISMKLEIDRVASEREIMDNFTLLYTYFKFLLYWIIGGIQLVIIYRESSDEELQK